LCGGLLLLCCICCSKRRTIEVVPEDAKYVNHPTVHWAMMKSELETSLEKCIGQPVQDFAFAIGFGPEGRVLIEGELATSSGYSVPCIAAVLSDMYLVDPPRQTAPCAIFLRVRADEHAAAGGRLQVYTTDTEAEELSGAVAERIHGSPMPNCPAATTAP